jgi:hypothetical protein
VEWVVDKEASQTRHYCVAKDATLGAARPDPSRRKERLLGMTIDLRLYGKQGDGWLCGLGYNLATDEPDLWRQIGSV